MGLDGVRKFLSINKPDEAQPYLCDGQASAALEVAGIVPGALRRAVINAGEQERWLMHCALQVDRPLGDSEYLVNCARVICQRIWS
jgi:hypothetical protein